MTSERARLDAVLSRPDADAVLAEARAWLAGCVWHDLDADAVGWAVSALTDAAVLWMVDAEYDGGLDAFVSAFAVVSDAPW